MVSRLKHRLMLALQMKSSRNLTILQLVKLMKHERFVFNQRCQSPDENFETFLTSIRTLIKTCNYHHGSVDSILRDRIVLGVIDKETQKRLLREADLTLVKCIAICKAAENASEQVKALNPPSSNNHVNMTKKQTTYSHKPQSTSKHTPPVLDCKFCGKKTCVA